MYSKLFQCFFPKSPFQYTVIGAARVIVRTVSDYVEGYREYEAADRVST